jgi:hypothetical protein
MRIWSVAKVIGLVLVVAACPRERDPEVPPEVEAVAPAHDPGALPEAAQTIPLEPLPGEVLSAEAVIVPVGTQTQITVLIHEGPPGTSITAHLVTGTCQQPGPTTADLQPVTTDAVGQGTSQIVVDTAPEVVVNGNHLVQLRRENGRAGVPAACGEIPAHPVLYDDM